MATTAGKNAPFKSGDEATDFKLEGIYAPFVEKDFGGLKRANESFLSNIEQGASCLLWKEGFLDPNGGCTVRVATGGGKFTRSRDGVQWSGWLEAIKDGKRASKWAFYADFVQPSQSKVAIMESMHMKVYKKQRDALKEKCA